LKGKEQRKRWSEKVDKRMSRISGEWRSLSFAGAREGIEGVRESLEAAAAAGRRSVSEKGQLSSNMSLQFAESPMTGRAGPQFTIGQLSPTRVGFRAGGGELSELGGDHLRLSRVSFADSLNVNYYSATDAHPPSPRSAKFQVGGRDAPPSPRSVTFATTPTLDGVGIGTGLESPTKSPTRSVFGGILKKGGTGTGSGGRADEFQMSPLQIGGASEVGSGELSGAYLFIFVLLSWHLPPARGAFEC
jgi:hypothetical protein